MWGLFIFSLLTLTSAAKNLDILGLYTNTFEGDGTYYWFTEDGTCSYTPPRLPPVAYHPSITGFVALNRPQFFRSLACGMCLSVNGTGSGLGLDPISGQHIVFVKDLCPGCKTGDVDFSKTGDGRWDIVIQAIQCPVGNTSIEYKFQGSNRYYLKLQVRNARIPATAVDMKSRDMASWKQMNHTRDGFWTVNIQSGVTFPIQLRLTAANDEVILDMLAISSIVNEDVFYGNGVQFSFDPELPT
ncbi:uncharacterized protein [Argopecten irradians]|uniref:uncharacterized protein n=1 Tax=Argopecten irradians TaxID=31199 RepID=UPI003711CFA1